MSRGILINTLDTYIGTALYEEFLGDTPAESSYEIYGSWLNHDDSSKPAYVKKMMKRTKPVWFRKYMREKMDVYVYDLHTGRLDDLKWAIWALTNEPLESEKTLIVISSVLAWGGNEHKMMEVKPKKKKPVVEGEEGEEEPKEGENPEEEEKEEEEKEEEEKEKDDNEEKKEKEVDEDAKKESEAKEKKEPKYDEEGNWIEDPEENKGPEVDEYGNEILVAEWDGEGNEILPKSDEDFEYMFEEEYKAKKKWEKELEKARLKEEEDAKRIAEGEEPLPVDKSKNDDEEEKKDGDDEEKEGDENKKEDDEEGEKSENGSGSDKEEEEEKKRVYKRVIKIKIIKPKIYKRIGFSEKEYKKRVPIEFYQHFKDYEDELLKLKFENLNIYIVCAGIPYGGCETVFNYFFKSAWLQNPTALPYYNTGENWIPTIHIKDLARIIKRIAEGKSETPYIFAIDKTKDKSLRNWISSISINIGSGQTTSVEYDKNLIKNIVLKHEDFYIDINKYEKNKLVMSITKHELSWTRFLGIDVMLKPSKFIDEEFEWHCKEGIPAKSKKLLEEFCAYRKLRPLKIIMNCDNETWRKLYAEKLSKFYNIPVINFEWMMDKLNLNIEELTGEEQFMNDKYFKWKEKVEFLDQHPDYKNEANELLFDKTEILFECLKYLLTSNAAVNRGYVLEGIPVNMDEIDRLYYFKKEVKVEENEEEEKPEEEEEEDDEPEIEQQPEPQPEEKGEDKKEGEGEGEGEGEKKEDEENKEKNEEDENEEKEDKDDDGEEKEEKDNEDKPKDGAEGDDGEKKEDQQKEEAGDGDGDKPKEEDGENPENPEGEEGGKKKKKKKKPKKIKPKKWKSKFDKTLLPESVITINKIDTQTNEVSNIFWPVEEFYQQNNIEILDLVYEDEHEDPEEAFEMMRIYIERNGRPFNYFKWKDEDINNNRIQYVAEKQSKIESDNKKALDQAQKEKDDSEAKYWEQMEARIKTIKMAKDEWMENEKIPTRKFLLVNIMPTLTKGLLEVCKINPIDPIDYLANFIFTNSNEK